MLVNQLLVNKVRYSSLQLNIIQAKSLKKVNFGDQDPYMIIKCNNQQYRTKTINNVINSIVKWNESFKIAINSNNIEK